MVKKIKRKTRRTFSKDYKLEAVRLVTHGNRSAVEVAEELDISSTLLRKWVRTYQEEAEEAFRGNGNRTTAEEEIRQLKKQLRELKEENEILVKASAYFAKLQK